MEFTLKEYKSPVKCYYYQGEILYIYFQYNLFDPTKIKKHSHIILIDRFKKFFLAGIDNYFNDFRDTLNWLKQQIELLDPKKVVIIGCSLGGFPAILFGYLLKATYVYTFGATTCLDAEKLAVWGDTRYKNERHLLLLDTISKSNSKIIQYLDLKNLNLVEHGTQYMIFFTKHIPVDRLHAKNIERKGIILKEVDTKKDHHIANIAEILPKIIK